MLLFNISASAQGRTILDGKKLFYEDVLNAMAYIEQYSRIIPVSINITSMNHSDKSGGPHDYIDVIFLNEFINGWKKPHVVRLDDPELRIATDDKPYGDDDSGVGKWKNDGALYTPWE